ncbi:MAG: SEL1-like repeat protein [Epulopiscium sp.]|nr:SEL1-like repeat protein [Candidatus Epulonipiscium sp.]
MLGYSYYYGKGCEVDMDKAKFWFQKAAEQRDLEAEMYWNVLQVELFTAC